MEGALQSAGRSVRVIEDALNGRRTVWEDPFKAGRNGLVGLEQRMEVNSPLSMVLLMLGTNDFQSMHEHNAWHSAQGIAALVQAIRRAPIEPGMPIPRIIVIAPPPARAPKGAIAPKFLGADTKSAGLADAYRQVARELDCGFFDSATVIASSVVDGVHLDADQHAVLGHAMAELVGQLLPVLNSVTV
jgi:lysophospholipase L1-like esterase